MVTKTSTGFAKIGFDIWPRVMHIQKLCSLKMQLAPKIWWVTSSSIILLLKCYGMVCWFLEIMKTLFADTVDTIQFSSVVHAFV